MGEIVRVDRARLIDFWGYPRKHRIFALLGPGDFADLEVSSVASTLSGREVLVFANGAMLLREHVVPRTGRLRSGRRALTKSQEEGREVLLQARILMGP